MNYYLNPSIGQPPDLNVDEPCPDELLRAWGQALSEWLGTNNPRPGSTTASPVARRPSASLQPSVLPENCLRVADGHFGDNVPSGGQAVVEGSVTNQCSEPVAAAIGLSYLSRSETS